MPSEGVLAEKERETVVSLISNRWASLAEAIEEEMCGICDFIGGAHQGRAEGTSLAQRQVLPRRAAGSHGNMGQAEFAVVWGANRLRELLALSDIHASRNGLTEGQRQQWDRLVRKVCSPSAPIFCAEGRWEDTLATLQTPPKAGSRGGQCVASRAQLGFCTCEQTGQGAFASQISFMAGMEKEAV